MRGVLAGRIQFVRAFCQGMEKTSCPGEPGQVRRSFERVLDLNRPSQPRLSDLGSEKGRI
jgi:hypothetical protein